MKMVTPIFMIYLRIIRNLYNPETNHLKIHQEKGIDIKFLFQYAGIRVAGSSLFSDSNPRRTFFVRSVLLLTYEIRSVEKCIMHISEEHTMKLVSGGVPCC